MDLNQSLESRQSVRVGQYEVSVFMCALGAVFARNFGWETPPITATF